MTLRMNTRVPSNGTSSFARFDTPLRDAKARAPLDFEWPHPFAFFPLKTL